MSDQKEMTVIWKSPWIEYPGPHRLQSTAVERVERIDWPERVKELEERVARLEERLAQMGLE